MSMSIGWTETTSKEFERFIVGFLKVTPSLYRLLGNNGLIRNEKDGIDKFNYLKAQAIDGGKMASSIHQHNIVTPQWEEIDVDFLYLNTLIRISKQDIDKTFNTKGRINGDLAQEAIRQVMRTNLDQIDQFCAWGDRMKDSLAALDKFRNTDTFTGLFNSGTTIAGGADGGDDMTVLGDFKATVGNMRKALRSAAHEMQEYLILSDLETFNIADNNATHEYANVGISEAQRILEKKYIKDWMDSDNFIDSSELKFRMAMVAPKQISPTAVGNKGIVNNFELVQGYPFRVIPINNGGVSEDGYIMWKIVWSGAFVVYHDTAIQHTGDLTLT